MCVCLGWKYQLGLNTADRSPLCYNSQSQGLTKVMPFALGMFVDVFFGKAGEEDAVEAGVESVQVGAAHVADA